MFPLRLLIALCAAPLVMATFTGVAYLGLRGNPLFLLLALAGIMLALVVGWDIHNHCEAKNATVLMFAGGIVLTTTIFAAYVATISSAAPRHMCTVVESRTLHRLSPGGEATYNYRRLDCEDGRTDHLGNELAAEKGTDTTDRYKGTRLLVAYDPNGWLPSMVVDDQVLWSVGAGIGMTVVLTLHTGVVIADQRRR
ncbi:hypothetical protein [Streptomyces sp. NPDC017991]|uniref:hypothetical protein n=1 Tax=Streptomyces sp. NPDC017991 TaxID=3365026 RepID=UPI0037A0F020